MRAVITVIGKDKIGIIAGISNIFTMVMLVDISKLCVQFAELAKKGVEMGLSVRIQHEDIFNSMHRI